MKKKVIFLVVAALAVAGTSCSDEEVLTGNSGNASSNGRSAVHFSTQLPQSKTISAGGDVTHWVANDPVGIFMFNAGTTTIAEQVDNRQYLATPGGDARSATFAPATVNDTIYYPLDETQQVDFIVYYPRKASINNDVYPVDVSDQSDPAALDVLWSNNATSVAQSDNAVNLTFEHQLARLTIKIVKGNNMSSVDFTSSTAELLGLPLTASLSLTTGTLSNLVTGTFNAELVSSDTDSATFEAVIIPNDGTANPDRTIIFTVDGKEHKFAIPNGTTFAKGEHYPYRLKVSQAIELELLDKTGWTVTASSTDASSLPGVDAVIDGVVTDASHWLASGSYPHWIIIDMQAPVEVGRIVTIRGLDGRSWFGITRDLNYTISNDPDFTNPVAWADDVTGTYPGSGTGGGIESNTLSLDVIPAITGRYIKLRMDGPSTIGGPNADICEIDVYKVK
ncbi:hypothetical protein FACS1894121_1130 [Bacteroidia bacterium]|nr:hypothetical protein FACS1894121_1130 [Bacteroidia bacterium]